MDAQPDPTAPGGPGGAQREAADMQMQMRRSPRYGVFMALGALLGAVLAWWLSATMPPALNPAGEPVDTTPVIGLMLVVGFFAGGSAGALLAVIIDRAMAKRLTPVVAERTQVHAADASAEVADDSARARDEQVRDAGARDAATGGETIRDEDPDRDALGEDDRRPGA